MSSLDTQRLLDKGDNTDEYSSEPTEETNTET